MAAATVVVVTVAATVVTVRVAATVGMAMEVSKSKAAWFPSASHHSQKWLGLG